MQILTLLHDHAIIILTLVITLVAYAIFALLQRKFTARYLLEAQQIETI